jgi:tetratricopeptide (TPR) repeat protein
MDTEYFIARYYYALDELDQADVLTSQLLLDARRSGIGKVESRALLLLADVSFRRGDIEKTRLFLHEALDVDEKASGETREMVYSRLWKIYADKGEYVMATSYLRKQLEICEMRKDMLGMSYAQNNMGELLERQQLFDRALEQYKLSLAYKRERGDAFGMIWTMRNMAMLLLKMGRVAEAEVYIEELLELDADSLQTQLVLSRLEYEKGNYRSALVQMASLRQQATGKGAWNENWEKAYQVFQLAANQSKSLELPPLYGNN